LCRCVPMPRRLRSVSQPENIRENGCGTRLAGRSPLCRGVELTHAYTISSSRCAWRAARKAVLLVKTVSPTRPRCPQRSGALSAAADRGRSTPGRCAGVHDGQRLQLRAEYRRSLPRCVSLPSPSQSNGRSRSAAERGPAVVDGVPRLHESVRGRGLQRRGRCAQCLQLHDEALPSPVREHRRSRRERAARLTGTSRPHMSFVRRYRRQLEALRSLTHHAKRLARSR
jgi:hypothetical protein